MNDEYKWGDDPGVAIEKATGSRLASRIEDDVVAGYLLQLRTLLEENADLAAKVAVATPAKNAKPHLIGAFKLVKPGTSYLLDRAADILLDELEQQRKNPSLYLVSCKTGRSVMPIGAKDVYTPPDFANLDGQPCKSKPIVHPGITSSLAIAGHEAAKQEALVSIAGHELAFAHLSDPEQMVERARQKLAGIVTFEKMDGPWREIVFGKEHVSGMEQSVNSSFHRVELFSSTLAKKILTLCGRGGRCQTGGVSNQRGSKQRWYVLSVKFQRLDIPDA